MFIISLQNIQFSFCSRILYGFIFPKTSVIENSIGYQKLRIKCQDFFRNWMNLKFSRCYVDLSFIISYDVAVDTA